MLFQYYNGGRNITTVLSWLKNEQAMQKGKKLPTRSGSFCGNFILQACIVIPSQLFEIIVYVDLFFVHFKYSIQKLHTTPFGDNLKDWKPENNNNKNGDKVEGRAEIDIFSLRILMGTREEAEGRVNPGLVSLLFVISQ